MQEITDHLAEHVHGLEQSGDRIGSASARVELTFWADLQCPRCKAFALTTLSALLAREVRDGLLSVRFRPLDTVTRDVQTFVLQQAAAQAAGAQDRLWDYVEAFFLTQRQENSGYVTPQHLAAVAQQIEGLDLQRWGQDTAGDHRRLLQDSADAARQAGVTGTPGLALRAGERTSGPVRPDPQSVRAGIRALLG